MSDGLAGLRIFFLCCTDLTEPVQSTQSVSQSPARVRRCVFGVQHLRRPRLAGRPESVGESIQGPGRRHQAATRSGCSVLHRGQRGPRETRSTNEKQVRRKGWNGNVDGTDRGSDG